MQVELVPQIALPEVAALFRHAFADDPGMQYICQYERKGYEKRLEAWFLATLQMQTRHQEPVLGIYVAGDYVACAILSTPKPQKKPTIKSLMQWMLDVCRHAGITTIWRTMRPLVQRDAYLPKVGHYRLEFIAVHPDHQGKGYGRALLDKIHDLAQHYPNAAGIWLETTNPANVPLYLHMGYAIQERLPMGNTEAIIMFRENPLPADS